MKTKTDESEQSENKEIEIAGEIASAYEIAKKVFGADVSPHVAFRIHGLIQDLDVEGDVVQEELLTARGAAAEIFGEAKVKADDDVVFEQYICMFGIDEDEDGEEEEDEND